MANTKYTFLLPAYKGQFLDDMLRSIQGQTYTDFKVIISDDCSPENLQSICEPYLSDPRFTYRRNDENMGSVSLVSHWNLLVDMCDTEFFIMASDDDIYEPSFLKEMDMLTMMYPKVDLYRARMTIIDESNNLLIRDPFMEEYYNHSHFFYQYYASNMLTCEANYIYRTKTMKRKGGYIEFPLAWFSDDATHIMMAANGCVNSTKYLFSYRKSPLAITYKWGEKEDAAYKTEASLEYWKWINDYLPIIIEEDELLLKTIALSNCKQKITKGLILYTQFLTRKQFMKYVRLCRKELGMSKIVLFYYWLRIYLHNKTHL